MADSIGKTDSIRGRYNRNAWFYNLMDAPMEILLARGWRSRFTGRIKGPEALEIGVGTGKNMPYYPEGVRMTAIDFSPRMLERAIKKAETQAIDAALLEMDVQHLDFEDNVFDTVFASFVFCSVPDPVLGLKELKRVCKPDGRLLLMEHVRPGGEILGPAFDLLNPLVVRMMGANINRRTAENVEKAGWRIKTVEYLYSDIVCWIEAGP